MTNLFANESSKIAAGRVVSGVADREQTLRVACGRVWITIEGSTRDYWLSAGASLQIAPGRLVVIEADGMDSRIHVPNPMKGHGALFPFNGNGMRDLNRHLARFFYQDGNRTCRA
jgi:hypothetical protein